MKIRLPQTFSTKIFLAIVLATAAVLGNIKFRQWQSKNRIEAEKQELLRQAEELSNKNQELAESLKYLNTMNFREKIARQQLGLKKEGENVYVFPEKLTAPETGQPGGNTGKNWQKWWNYFFAS
jgi:cell division protein FtsB